MSQGDKNVEIDVSEKGVKAKFSVDIVTESAGKAFSKVSDTVGTSLLTAAAMFFPNQVEKASEVVTTAKANRMRVLADARRSVEQIENGYKTIQGGHLVEIEPHRKTLEPHEVIIEAAERERVSRSLKQELVVAEVASKATDILEAGDESTISDKPVNDDWSERWKSHVRNITTEEAKNIWANVLASEVKKPGTISLRTLEFLNSTSREELNLLKKLFPFTVNGDRVVIDGNLKQFVEGFVPYGDLLKLESLGLLYGINGQTSFNFNLPAGSSTTIALELFDKVFSSFKIGIVISTFFMKTCVTLIGTYIM